ncbi:hypothetical protein BOTBODRAFT_31188 [Botryobasidium botryosum FD-172 SS1]|uniref:Uncharacterized protein n=1 Tax=Botryobasidium botryosum (strain FD-172 SS1) TaxID=930990 RepID=A0A067MKN4_BOTB1|nr:hypothetical protein BOTBODRAFT_31188 [Botryobasidium botryosum FD-172 SS1]
MERHSSRSSGSWTRQQFPPYRDSSPIPVPGQYYPSTPSPPSSQLPPNWSQLSPRDLFYDPRTDPGPSWQVRTSLGSPGACAAIAMSEDQVTCAVAGKQSLRILRILEPPISSNVSRTQPDAQSKRFSKAAVEGPGGASIMEESDIWPTGKLGVNNASTDVVWMRGAHTGKVVTACVNGDLIHWDVNQGRHRPVREHVRAVNKICTSSISSSVLVSGSQDGFLKLWDFRTPYKSRLSLQHPTAVRTLILSPVASTALSALVALESGTLVHWDLRKCRTALDRVNVAHRGAILGIDWVGPSIWMGPPSEVPSNIAGSNGWVCTGGMDRTVKIWDMSFPHLSQNPTHTLHTSFPVRSVSWRPSHDTEIAVVPLAHGISSARQPDNKNTGGANYGSSIELWDVRRNWIPKYLLPSVEGSITDVLWNGAGALLATYANGTLVQHDVRASYCPLNDLPRAALTYDVSGKMTFVSERVTNEDVPFDDWKPTWRQYLAERAVMGIPKEKNPSEPAFKPSRQAIATVTVPAFDADDWDADGFDWEVFAKLARKYRIEGEDRAQICLYNAKVARQAAQYRAAQTWEILSILLTSPVRPQNDVDAGVIEELFMTRRSSHSNVHFPDQYPFSAGPSPPQPPKRLAHRRTVSIDTPDTPDESRSVSRYPRTLGKLVHRRMSLSAKRRIPTPESNPGSGRTSSEGSRESSKSRNPSTERREKRSVSRHVGDGALDDSSSSESAPESEGKGKMPERGRPGPHVINGSNGNNNSSNTPSSSSSSILKTFSSPLAQSPVTAEISSQKTTPDATPLETPRKRALPHRRKPGATPLPTGASSDETDVDSDDNYFSASRDADSPMVQAVVHPDEVVDPAEFSLTPIRPAPIALMVEHNLALRQRSYSSVRTAVPSRPSNRQSWAPSNNSSGTGSSDGADTRGSSPQGGSRLAGEGSTQQYLSPNAIHSSLPVVEEVAESPSRPRNGDVWSPPNQYDSPIPKGLLPKEGVKQRQKYIFDAEDRMRDAGWAAVRESVLYYIETGDVQMGTTLATVAGTELGLPDRATVMNQLTASYIDLLSRSRLHSSASYVRRYAPSDYLKNATKRGTTFYTVCGRCKKSIPGIKSSTNPDIPVRGGFGYCSSCKAAVVRCAICRLPVRGLHFFCQVCSHGGHHECYRKYYLHGTAAATDQESGGFGGGYKDSPKVHRCAAGCGHGCWTADMPPPFIGSRTHPSSTPITSHQTDPSLFS